MLDRHEINAALADSGKRLEALKASLKMEAKKARLAQIVEESSQPGFWENQEKAQRLMEEQRDLRAMLEPLQQALQRHEDNSTLLSLADEEGDEATVAEAADAILALRQELGGLEIMALLSGPHDGEPCFFSIHTGAGGSDACEWAEMLLRMYARHFEDRGWKVEELSYTAGEEAGIKGVDLRVNGPFAFGYLKGELGVHRLVRISPFSGKRETSFAAVDVVPDFQKEIDIKIEDKDLRIDTYRSGGKGGQHVNKTDSAVRITHLPSGIVVAVQNERSQHRNKDMALKILKSRLYARAEAEREAQASARNAGKMENAWGSQIRNYVMQPYQLVKDVRTGCEKGDIAKVLDGGIGDFIDSYLKWSAENRD